MLGRLEDWPAWPEFTEPTAESDQYCLDLKRTIVAHYGADSLFTSWVNVCDELEAITREIDRNGTAIIPDISFEEFKTITPEKSKLIMSRGCCVVRGVIPEHEAQQWFLDLKQYIADNEGSKSTDGWPNRNPILRLYYTPTQMAARSHPHQLELQKMLNCLWHDKSGETSPEPLTYCDAFKIRVPGIPFSGLGPHMDAGSLCRWADPTYRKVYDAVLSGKPCELDLFDLGARREADQAMFDEGAQSTVLRTFQGWTAITPLSSNEGGMLIYPNLRAVVSYMLLRPFFKKPTDGDVMDARKWTIDTDTPWFPGTFKDKSQMASLSSHPHLRLRDCMIHLPAMSTGDTVWWHSDVLHAVEVDHNGPEDTAVIYIAATPTTRINKLYIQKQLQDFREGHIPHDFRPGFDADERSLNGFQGEVAIKGEAGLRAFGVGISV